MNFNDSTAFQIGVRDLDWLFGSSEFIHLRAGDAKSASFTIRGKFDLLSAVEVIEDATLANFGFHTRALPVSLRTSSLSTFVMILRSLPNTGSK